MLLMLVLLMLPGVGVVDDVDVGVVVNIDVDTDTDRFYIIIIDNFCIALFSGVPELTALYNNLQHFLSFTNIIHIIMTINNV